MKIATHNSATGEKCKGILSYITYIFSKCQNKTIEEQMEHGVSFFDIRVKKIKNRWVCSHGLFHTKDDVDTILSKINSKKDNYVQLFYEGKSDPTFELKALEWVDKYNNIKFTQIGEKKPKWRIIKEINIVPIEGRFVHLDGSSWHTILPIPWLWKKIYYNKPKFNNNHYIMVDFL